MRTTLLAFLIASPLLVGGCVGVAAGAVGAVVITQEMLDNNTYVSQLNEDVKTVWSTVKIFLAENSLELIETDDHARLAKAKIDGAMVEVQVEAYDLDKTIMRVAARRFGVNDGELARTIMERILRQLEHQRGG